MQHLGEYDGRLYLKTSHLVEGGIEEAIELAKLSGQLVSFECNEVIIEVVGQSNPEVIAQMYYELAASGSRGGKVGP